MSAHGFARPCAALVAAIGACSVYGAEDEAPAPPRDIGPDASIDASADGASSEDASDGGGANDVDAKVAPPLVLSVSGNWSSPNGAAWSVGSGGTGVQIIGMDASSQNHPVIVPLPQPPIPSDDYTVRATVRAPSARGEFGIMARLQADGTGVLLGSAYGTATQPVLAEMGPPAWNPQKAVTGVPYTFVPSGIYRLSLRVSGNIVSGKVWLSSDAEPPNAQVVTTFSTEGRGVAFYTYFIHDTVLEELSVTVP